jgi:hypothetical protein
MVAKMNQVPENAHDVHTLIAWGDAACARGDGEALARIAGMLVLCFDFPAQSELREIARLGRADVAAASERWRQLTRRLDEMLAFVETPVHRD